LTAVPGSATPIRGKSQTCRQSRFFDGSSTRRSQTANFVKLFRQVRDLPPISLAKPYAK